MAGRWLRGRKVPVSRDIGDSNSSRVRAASPETLIIANGFSCREQIAQSTDRHALHLAEVLQMALRQERSGVFTKPEAYPEAPSVTLREAGNPHSMQKTVVSGSRWTGGSRFKPFCKMS